MGRRCSRALASAASCSGATSTSEEAHTSRADQDAAGTCSGAAIRVHRFFQPLFCLNERTGKNISNVPIPVRRSSVALEAPYGGIVKISWLCPRLSRNKTTSRPAGSRPCALGRSRPCPTYRACLSKGGALRVTDVDGETPPPHRGRVLRSRGGSVARRHRVID
jgi:hypothetical protein